MITPMIAAYFLAAQGEQSHAEGPWIDRYERLLRWTLDNSKHRAKRAGYDPVPTRPGFLWFPFAAAAVSVLLSIVQYFQTVPAGQSAPNPPLHLLLMTTTSAVVFFLVAALAAILSGALSVKFGEQRFNCPAGALYSGLSAW